MTKSLENAVLAWEDGYRRLEAARSDPKGYRVLGKIVVALGAELRKRLGSTFSVAELERLYREGTDWCLEVAIDTAPGDTGSFDPGAACDAAFYLYMREASDFAGGQLTSDQVM